MFSPIYKRIGATFFWMILSFILFQKTNAEIASESEMTQVCRNWLSEVVNNKAAWAGSLTPQIADSKAIIVNDTIVGHFFEIYPSGFVVIPRLKEMVPIKLYSETGKLDIYNEEGLAGLIKDVLSAQTSQFAVVYGDLAACQPAWGEVLFDRDQRAQWDKYLIDDKSFVTGLSSSKSMSMGSYGPLVTTHWSQGSPYNNFCPLGSYGVKTVVGCVATAASQIMAYHQWPVHGEGSKHFFWPGDYTCGFMTSGAFLEAYFTDLYDWPNIPSVCGNASPIEQQNAVAELCYEVGMAFNMYYGVCASGAQVKEIAPGIYHNYFRYRESVRAVRRSDYDYRGWVELIMNEIIAGRPIQYQIRSHSLICDGFQDDEGLAFIHMNYGWNGNQDGWYMIDKLYCNWYGCDYMIEDMVIGIEPDRRAYLLNDTTYGILPLTVNFTGLSSFDSVDRWIWNFGDGVSSTAQSPTHVYENGGRYTVTLKTIAGADTGIYIANNYICALNDSLICNNTQGRQNSVVEVTIDIRNAVPLRRMVIPVTFSGPLNLQFVDYSVAGCRAEYFDFISQPIFDGANGRTVFVLENINPNTNPDLAPGFGPLIKLYFSIPASARLDQTATIGFAPFYSNTATFKGYGISYTPTLAQGVISLAFICGDANHNGSINLLDVSYIINYLYRGGSKPNPIESADVNGDGTVNLLDISHLINYLYRNGPTPICL